ncbi:MAG TPA: heavy metal-associated domain-containing protein [Candidatus Acidoferrales bacterium]|nr:heavy metal-associated domain-containing protein [Candidatus Acidoferrales bacterium]
MATQTLKLPVRGMTCGGCARTVEKKLASTPGVARVTVDLEGGNATVEYDSSAVQPENLANAVRQLGYEVPV